MLEIANKGPNDNIFISTTSTSVADIITWFDS